MNVFTVACRHHHRDNGESKLKLRKVVFYDRVLKCKFEFLTDLFGMRPDMIAAIYKIRWQIELLYKQLKGNFPLRYFSGDNENAIKIQIYCVLFVNLLLTAIQKRLKRPMGIPDPGVILQDALVQLSAFDEIFRKY